MTNTPRRLQLFAPCGLCLLLSPELADVQVIVQPLPRQQLLVRSPLSNPTILDEDHLVGVPNGAQSVGDNKAGSALQQPTQSFLDERTLCVYQRSTSPHPV